jgi:hypothetical protein
VTLKIMALSFNRDSNDSDNHGIVVEHTIKWQLEWWHYWTTDSNDTENDGSIVQQTPMTAVMMALLFNIDSNYSKDGVIVQHRLKRQR